MTDGSRFYSYFLHGMLVALAICSVLLVRQNRLLVEQLTPPVAQSAFEVGEPLASFEVEEAGTGTRLLDFGPAQRPRLLFFFSTSCGACRENQQHWRELYSKVEGSTEVLGVSLDDSEATRTYVEEMGLPFPTVSLAHPEAVTEILGITQIPETVLIDPGGTVAESRLGILSPEDIERFGLDS